MLRLWSDSWHQPPGSLSAGEFAAWKQLEAAFGSKLWSSCLVRIPWYITTCYQQLPHDSSHSKPFLHLNQLNHQRSSFPTSKIINSKLHIPTSQGWSPAYPPQLAWWLRPPRCITRPPGIRGSRRPWAWGPRFSMFFHDFDMENPWKIDGHVPLRWLPSWKSEISVWFGDCFLVNSDEIPKNKKGTHSWYKMLEESSKWKMLEYLHVDHEIMKRWSLKHCRMDVDTNGTSQNDMNPSSVYIFYHIQVIHYTTGIS